MKKNTHFNYRPDLGAELIAKFIEGVGQDAKKYFGKDKGCIVGLKDEGVFYGEALYQWLGNKNLTFTVMDDDGHGLEEEKLRSRKVLIVDNDIVTGKGFKKAKETVRKKKDQLKIKDIKFAVLRDRMDLADFSVEGYDVFAPWSLNQLDGLDLEILKFLLEDGRVPFVDIAKKTGLSPVGIKNRVEKLIGQGVLRIQGGLRMESFNFLSAYIGVEADKDATDKIIERLQKSPLVYHLVKASGSYNLLINAVASNMTQIERLITKEIRRNPGVKKIEVNVGDLPIIPKTWEPPIN